MTMMLLLMMIEDEMRLMKDESVNFAAAYMFCNTSYVILI
jgi:hypothetical protein